MHGDEFRAVALAELSTKLRLKLALGALQAAAAVARQRCRLLMLLDACDERDLQREVFGQPFSSRPHMGSAYTHPDVLLRSSRDTS